MAIKTATQLRTDAQVIKNEVTTGANTALRVGTFLDEVIESMDSLIGDFWQHYRDSTYTSGSTLQIAAGNRVQITNDGLTRNIASPNGYANVWNTTLNKLEPIAEDDFYTIRLDFKAHSDIAATNRFDIEMDIGGAIGVLAARTMVFAKGAGNEQQFAPSTQFFVGSTFIANGATIYIIPEADASFWDIGITVSRTYTPQV